MGERQSTVHDFGSIVSRTALWVKLRHYPYWVRFEPRVLVLKQLFVVASLPFNLGNA